MTKEQIQAELKQLYGQSNDLQMKIDQAWTWQLTLKVFINRVYGYFGNKMSAMSDPDIARSITLTGQHMIKKSHVLANEFIAKSIGEDILDITETYIYSDTDSVYISILPFTEKNNLPIKTFNNEVNSIIYKFANELENYINTEVEKWSKRVLLTHDPRFVFKRESICDKALFLQKKRYVLHKLDDEGVPCDYFKYTGVDVVRSTMPKAIKPHVKRIIENMVMSNDYKTTNAIVQEIYDIFVNLPIEDIALVMGIKNYEKYAIKSKEFSIVKGTPIHVKSSIYHNVLLKEFNIENNYEKIRSGDKIQYFYVQTPNKYGIKSIAFKGVYPEPFKQDIKMDYNKMFHKIIFSVVERCYECVNWKPYDPNDQTTVDLFSEFAL